MELLEIEKIGAIDADIVAYRVAAALQPIIKEELELGLNEAEIIENQLPELYKGIDAFLYKIQELANTNTFCLLLSGSDNFRKKVAVTKPYKGNRDKLERPLLLSYARDYLITNYKALVCKEHEADDGIASLKDLYGADCYVISVDKDLKQLPGVFIDPVKAEKYTVTHAESLYRLATQMLTGDSTDNITGIPKIGAVKAEKILQEGARKGWSAIRTARAYYETAGFDYNYWEEHLQLVRMRKDFKADFEAHFVEFGFEEPVYVGGYDEDLI